VFHHGALTQHRSQPLPEMAGFRRILFSVPEKMDNHIVVNSGVAVDTELQSFGLGIDRGSNEVDQ
jgi:hypothetical protein